MCISMQAGGIVERCKYVAEGDSGRVMQRLHGPGVMQVSHKGLQMGQKKLKER